MNLLQALAKTPLTWTLEKSSKPYEPNPQHTVDTMLLKVVPEPGATLIEKHFRVSSNISVEHMMALLMKESLKDNDVLSDWLDSHGNVPVKLIISEENLQYIGEPMHTGLRKLADSKESIITWNALHHLHPDDRVAVWVAAAELVKSAFSREKPPTRRNLAKSLKEKVIATLESQMDKAREKARTRKTRTDAELFALLMLTMGCHLTSMEEWMWGWLGYVVEDLPMETEQEATTS